MDTCSDNFCLDSEWQATSVGLTRNLRNAILAVSENPMKIYTQVPKPLTRTAVYMICVILIFVLFGAAGSAITVYEFLLDSRAKKRKKHENYTDIIKKSFRVKEEKKSKSSSAWLNGLKSFLGCFCFLKNGKNLLSTSSNSDQFKCMHGIRVINNVMVIFYHLYGFHFLSLRHAEELKPLFGTWLSPLLLSSYYAVDAFFVLSGFLNAYMFFNNYDKTNGNVSWLYFYLKRFVRITPVYMVVLGFYTFLFPYMGSGPLWPTFDTNPVCTEKWLWSLLFINNFIDHTKQCMEWCWYLAADMQFYIISPIFLILLKRNRTLGYTLTGACIAASCIAKFVITKEYNLIDVISRLEYHLSDLDHFFYQVWMYFDLIHIKPHLRISSYLVGILLAYYLNKNNINTIKCSKIILFIGRIVTCILWFIIYFALLLKREESITENAVYNGINSLFYSIGLSWIIFECLTRQEGLVNRCLSWKVFFPLAKLSYCAYLIHPIILRRYYHTVKRFEVFSAFTMIVLSAYFLFWIYVLSFITSLVFEIPVLNLLDLISTKHKMVKKLGSRN